jgi:hypothetical protein
MILTTMLAAVLVLITVGALAGCGISQQSPDLFLLTRTGEGTTRSVLIRDDGTLTCDGHTGTALSDAQVLVARDLQSSLDADAKKPPKLAPPTAGSVYSYSFKLQDGTISFADTSAASHTELARAELFATQVIDSACPRS